jgi:hypothetical protein
VSGIGSSRFFFVIETSSRDNNRKAKYSTAEFNVWYVIDEEIVGVALPFVWRKEIAVFAGVTSA